MLLLISLSLSTRAALQMCSCVRVGFLEKRARLTYARFIMACIATKGYSRSMYYRKGKKVDDEISSIS